MFVPLAVRPVRLRQDRIPDEARHTADPVHLVRVFGINAATAMAYVQAAGVSSPGSELAAARVIRAAASESGERPEGQQQAAAAGSPELASSAGAQQAGAGMVSSPMVSASALTT
jgi:hypothetical protein